MSILAQNQTYKNVFGGAVSDDSISIPIFCADFKTIQFTIVPDSSADFDINVYVSNQNPSDQQPPDLSVPSTTDNQYAPVAYIDTATGGAYTSSSLYNPSGTSGATKIFEVNTNGARWVFITVENYSAGELSVCDVQLFSNFV